MNILYLSIMELTLIQKIVVWIIPVLFAITVHEAAHGYVAYKFGDTTAKALGRLSLNPLKHIDFFGTIILPLIIGLLSGFIFGYAKPVPINPKNFKNPKRDGAIVALAGPGSNLLMALIWGGVLKFAIVMFSNQSMLFYFMAFMAQAGISINLVLMILNILPIPPLDGSHVLDSLLSPKASYNYMKLAPYGFLIIIILLFTGILSAILVPLINFSFTFIKLLFGI